MTYTDLELVTVWLDSYRGCEVPTQLQQCAPLLPGGLSLSFWKNQNFHSFTMMTIVIMIIMNTIIVKSIINLMTTLSSQPLVPVLLRLRSPSMRSTVWPWQKKSGVEQSKTCLVYFGQILNIDDQKLISQKSKDQSKNISGQSSTWFATRLQTHSRPPR